MVALEIPSELKKSFDQTNKIFSTSSPSSAIRSHSLLMTSKNLCLAIELFRKSPVSMLDAKRPRCKSLKCPIYFEHLEEEKKLENINQDNNYEKD